ncbi:restriction endonuclease subunit S [Staphylococcus epidermidis]|nr:restriction endonuclease subunit S [Staphylococcus epidermidis]MCG1730452.1 restriction endonuclease subunit S [Staphylococcus epidermidis]
MTEQINTPELRFPEFKNEWKLEKLGNLANIVRGASPRPIKDSKWFDDNSDIGWLRISDVTQQNGKIKFLQQHLSTEGQKKTRVLYEPHLLLSIAASVGKPVINYIKTGVHDGFLIFMKPKFDLYFMFNWLENFQLKWNKYGQAGSQVNLNSNLVKSQNIYIPYSYEEEEKIGTFFSKLDCQIELEEKKLEFLEQQKRGYMQKIFSQEFRFKDENGNDYPEWEDKLISDIGKVITGNTPSKKENDYWNSNQYIWVTPTDISNKKNIYTSGYQLSQKGFSKARQLPKNTLLITCIASIGKNAILRIEGSCNQQINAVIPNDNYDVDYLYYAFEDVSKLMKSIAGKTATQIVNKAVFEKLLLNVPIYEEQQKISGFLNKVDILIDKQAQKIDELKLRKQGFLQKMFV